MSKKVFIFAGQGAQYVGMGKDLYESYTIAQEMFNLAEEILPNIKKVCFEGPETELKLTKYTQVGIFVVSAILNDIIIKEKNIIPDIVAGFSLGEYSALYSAGCFDFKTGLEIVSLRAYSMHQASIENPGSMAAIIGLEDNVVEEVCYEISKKGEILLPVNYNAPGQLVISGQIPTVEKAVEILKSKGAKRAVILNVSGAFHTPLMEPARKKIEEKLNTINLNKPKIPIIMNAEAEIVVQPEKIKQLIIKQIISPVLWKQSMQKLIEMGFSEFYEIGPGKVLSGLMRSLNPQIICKNIQNISDLEKI